MGLVTIRRASTIALLLWSFAANAAITLAPGTVLQPARRGATFPTPVRLLVTDDVGRPVAGQVVELTTFHSTFALVFDAGFYYTFATTDSAGIATLSPLTGIAVGKTVFDVDAYPYGSMVLELEVADAPLPARLIPISGPDAPIAAGATSSIPFRVRVVDAVGDAVAFATVGFDASSTQFTRGTFDGELGAAAVADADGVATSPLLSLAMPDPAYLAAATTYPAQGALRVANGYGGTQNITVSIPFTVVKPDTPANTQDLWWGGAAENGWGVSIFEHQDLYGQILFVILFVYDQDGKPVWYVMPSGNWAYGYGTRWSGQLYKAKGAPFHNYDAASHSLGTQIGDATLTFIGSGGVKLEYDLYASRADLGRGTKRLQRLDFSNDAASPRSGVADLWWGGEAQNGWGLAVHEQKGALFSLWFTYGDDHAPTWFAMPAGAWIDANTYAGDIFSPSGSRWTDVPYDATKHSVTDVGSFKLRFGSGAPARQSSFDYVVGPYYGSISLSRVPFGLDQERGR